MSENKFAAAKNILSTIQKLTGADLGKFEHRLNVRLFYGVCPAMIEIMHDIRKISKQDTTTKAWPYVERAKVVVQKTFDQLRTAGVVVFGHYAGYRLDELTPEVLDGYLKNPGLEEVYRNHIEKVFEKWVETPGCVPFPCGKRRNLTLKQRRKLAKQRLVDVPTTMLAWWGDNVKGELTKEFIKLELKNRGWFDELPENWDFKFQSNGHTHTLEMVPDRQEENQFDASGSQSSCEVDYKTVYKLVRKVDGSPARLKDADEDLDLVPIRVKPVITGSKPSGWYLTKPYDIVGDELCCQFKAQKPGAKGVHHHSNTTWIQTEEGWRLFWVTHQTKDGKQVMMILPTTRFTSSELQPRYVRVDRRTRFFVTKSVRDLPNGATIVETRLPVNKDVWTKEPDDKYKMNIKPTPVGTVDLYDHLLEAMDRMENANNMEDLENATTVAINHYERLDAAESFRRPVLLQEIETLFDQKSNILLHKAETTDYKIKGIVEDDGEDSPKKIRAANRTLNRQSMQDEKEVSCCNENPAFVKGCQEWCKNELRKIKQQKRRNRRSRR